MKLSKVVGRYFDAWICRDTWDSFHPLDTQRFYHFVKAVARYSRRPPLPRDIKALIIERRGGGRRTTAALGKTADEFADRYQRLLEYEKTRGFPDALIERTDIVRFHLRLTSVSGSNHQHIDRRMTDVWGKDWQAKLHQALNTAREPPEAAHRWRSALQEASFMIKAAFVGIMILLMPSPALAEPILTITCHEPKGKRMEYGVFLYEYFDAKIKKKAPPKPRLHTVDDGYTGVTVTFIIDSAAPDKMTYLWGDTPEFEPYKNAARQFGIKVPAPTAQQAVIIVFNEELISTVENGPRYARLNSFFPKLGVAYFVQHEYRQIESAAWNVQISLFAKCEFAWKDNTPVPRVK